jgi:hypothetical protein
MRLGYFATSQYMYDLWQIMKWFALAIECAAMAHCGELTEQRGGWQRLHWPND